MSMVSFDKIIKILLKKGGYPSEFVTTLITFLGMSRYDFFKSIIAELGKEGAEQFIQNSLRNRSREGRIRISPGKYVAPGYEKESFIELDLDDVTVTIEDVDNEYWHNVVLEDWNVSDSNIVVETEDGEIEIYEVDGFLEEFQDLDPSDYEGALNEVEGAIERGLSNILGVKVYVEYSPFR
jgi:hypothetical protein